jgi:hypothetical protein
MLNHKDILLIVIPYINHRANISEEIKDGVTVKPKTVNW